MNTFSAILALQDYNERSNPRLLVPGYGINPCDLVQQIHYRAPITAKTTGKVANKATEPFIFFDWIC